MGRMMGYAMDQLRREGVPEQNLRQAAAHLVGQAFMESGLDPNKKHDKVGDRYTGFGIYGARDPRPGVGRMTNMLRWLGENGYASNSAEGQMRYMAHEAMSGKYSLTKRLLMSGAGVGSTALITKDFENPAVVNDRSGAVGNAFRIGPSQPDNRPIVLKPTSTPDFGKLNPGAFNVDSYLGSVTPMGGDTSTTNSQSLFNNPTTNVTITGVSDPKQAADYTHRAINDSNALQLRNMQSAIR